MDLPQGLVEAREQFLALVAEVRPELHRYCARLTGSVFDGEDIVQDALARAFYALSLQAEMPALRPWLFRIAHNAALDYLKSHGKKLTEPQVDVSDLGEGEDAPDPALVRAALGQFLGLPVAQRSAVILKDVLGHSLEEAAQTMGMSVMAVKAALGRGRAKLRETDEKTAELATPSRAELQRYASLFNARDWDGLRALLSEDCELYLVSRSERHGKQVRFYFERYERLNVTLRPVSLDGTVGLSVHEQDEKHASYFILLNFEAGRVVRIRDFRYVPYLAVDADPVLLTS